MRGCEAFLRRTPEDLEPTRMGTKVSRQPALYVPSGSAGQTTSCPMSEVVSETPEAQEAPSLSGHRVPRGVWHQGVWWRRGLSSHRRRAPVRSQLALLSLMS